MTKIILPQGDLSRLDSPLYGDIQGERTVAEFPFFALTKRAQMEPMTFESPDARIEINPSKTGVATIYDKEILLYIASLMVGRLERGETVDRTLSFTANDLFRMTGTNPSARSYTSLKASLTRLQGTQIITNIETGGEGSDSAFSWLLKADIKYTKLPNGERQMRHVEVMLCDWLHRAILTDRRIAGYHDHFFRLGPIERRLYELAKFNCLDGARFEADAVDLAGRVGCSLEPRSIENFKRTLREVAKTQSLPEYSLALTDRKEPRPGGGRPKLSTLVTITPLDTLRVAGPPAPGGDPAPTAEGDADPVAPADDGNRG